MGDAHRDGPHRHRATLSPSSGTERFDLPRAFPSSTNPKGKIHVKSVIHELPVVPPGPAPKRRLDARNGWTIWDGNGPMGAAGELGPIYG